MKKSIIGGIAVLAIAAVAIFNVNYNNSPGKNLSAVSLANVEALADESPGGEIYNCWETLTFDHAIGSVHKTYCLTCGPLICNTWSDKETCKK
jgi:hypothetical protein